MNRSRYTLPSATWNSLRTYGSTSKNQYPALFTGISNKLLQRCRNYQQYQTKYLLSNGVPQSPTESTSPVTVSAKRPTIISAAGEESILKEPTGTTTSTSTFGDTKDEQFTTSEQKPRPMFPWRHDIQPIPRLIPGTKEFVEARTGMFRDPTWQFWTERFNAFSILGVPATTVTFRFNQWKQSLANDSMYAFTSGVAGIVSNTYRIPANSVSSEVKEIDAISFVDRDDDDDDDTTTMIHFNYPPDNDHADPTALSKQMNDEILSILKHAFDIDNIEESNDGTTQTKNQIQTSGSPTKDFKNGEALGRDGKPNALAEPMASDPSTAHALDKSIVNDKVNAPEISSVTATSDTSNVSNGPPTYSSVNESQNLDGSSSSSSLNDSALNEESQRHPAFSKPLISKSYGSEIRATKSSSNVSGTDNAEQDQFCSNINDMMIEPLRKLYQSAHESGRDQLKIKLHVRPIDAKFLSLIAFPNVSREQGPAKIKIMQEKGARSFRDVFDYVYSDVMEDQKLETTVEMQVCITCLESFHVIDSQTGVVLQGSVGGLPQHVTHIVRFERTVRTDVEELTSTYSNWKITDIDDMLGHKAWYIF